MAARNREIREAARAQSPANAPAPVSVPDSSLKKCVSFSFQGTQVNCVNQLGFGTYGVVYSASVGPAPGLPVVAVKVPRSSKLGEGPSPCSIYGSTFGLCAGTTVALVLELGVGPLRHHLASEKLGTEANGMYPRKLHRRWAWAHQLATIGLLTWSADFAWGSEARQLHSFRGISRFDCEARRLQLSTELGEWRCSRWQVALFCALPPCRASISSCSEGGVQQTNEKQHAGWNSSRTSSGSLCVRFIFVLGLTCGRWGAFSLMCSQQSRAITWCHRLTSFLGSRSQLWLALWRP